MQLRLNNEVRWTPRGNGPSRPRFPGPSVAEVSERDGSGNPSVFGQRRPTPSAVSTSSSAFSPRAEISERDGSGTLRCLDNGALHLRQSRRHRVPHLRVQESLRETATETFRCLDNSVLHLRQSRCHRVPPLHVQESLRETAAETFRCADNGVLHLRQSRRHRVPPYVSSSACLL